MGTSVMPSPRKASKRSRRPSRAGVDWKTVPLRVNLAGKSVTPAGYAQDCRYVSRRDRLWRLQDQDLWLIVKGNGVWRIGRKSYEFEPGSCLWLRPGLQRQLRFENTAETICLWIHFDTLRSPRGQAFVPPASDLPPPVVEIVDVDTVAVAAARVLSLINPPVPYRSEAEVSEARGAAQAWLRVVILEFLAAARGSTAEAELDLRHRRAVARVAAAMHDDPAACSDLRRLAAEQGYERRYFARVFKACTGLTMPEFLVRSRINRARALLTERTLSVGEVAELLGYRDIYFFSRQFKKYAGCSPGRYAREH